MTTSTTPVFNFHNNQIRVHTEQDGAPWFSAKDVCTALAITWSGSTLKAIPEEWKGMLRFNTPGNPGRGGGGNQRLKAINEPAVYKLAFRSNKPEADKFTTWVAGEVLPSIRKTGRYEKDCPVPVQPHRRTKPKKL